MEKLSNLTNTALLAFVVNSPYPNYGHGEAVLGSLRHIRCMPYLSVAEFVSP